MADCWLGDSSHHRPAHDHSPSGGVPSLSYGMTKHDLLRRANRTERLLFAAVAGVWLTLTGLPSGLELAQAQTTAPTQEFRYSLKLPLTSFYNTAHPLPVGKPGALIQSEAADQYNFFYELSALRILYHSRTANGKDVAVSAVVLVPDGKPPGGGWPVIAWAHEFRGTARQCAPSLMKNLGAGSILAMFANLGFAVVATDYAGLGADSNQPVVDMESNALDILYSIPAARAAVKEIGKRWIALGTYQGALAAVGVAQSAVRDPNYLGSVAVSGLADAREVYERMALRSAKRMLLELESTVKALYPEFQVSDLLKDPSSSADQRVSQICGGVTEHEFTNGALKPGWENNPQVVKYFDRNAPSQKPVNGPLLVISAEADSAVPAEISAKTVAGMCKKGRRIFFLKYRDLDASSVMGTSTAEQISWIKARFDGYAAPSNCP
jgi:hypothetical protein